MSGSAELTGIYSAIEEAARLLDVPCSRDKVWPVLTTYGDALGQAVVAFRVATGARNAGELDCRFTMLPKNVDPYALALTAGLTTGTDHPVGVLLADLADRCPIDCYGIDFGVVDGFKKTWSFFPPDDLQSLSTLADIPSMPRSLAENVSFFARHDLDDKASLIGIDYPHRTVNVYFGEAPAECFEPKNIRSMLREVELPEPTEQLLRLGQESFGIYATLRWDSPKIERITFATMTPDPTTLPVALEPEIERFVKNAPYDYDAADRRFVYAVTSSTAGEYYKLQSYYRWRPQMLDLMLLSESVEDLV
ncbi:Aromatic prenyltransferase Orf2 [Micromonospora pallida]|uniref:Aromatic prenyltransferase Orf2 n=1 Tax=Micromonospora pallida TaxID=145854 RepID=A0A1C6SSG3_9ACTN|nr:aromatic prenyltransferase [Micromonospora pallida]SCL32322.1 Aromatic prenyltransferase Orf2 [Micromonospora pallida]